MYDENIEKWTSFPTTGGRPIHAIVEFVMPVK